MLGGIHNPFANGLKQLKTEDLQKFLSTSMSTTFLTMLKDTARIFCHLLRGVMSHAVSKLKYIRSEVYVRGILRSHSCTGSVMAKLGWEHPPHPAPGAVLLLATRFPHLGSLTSK